MEKYINGIACEKEVEMLVFDSSIINDDIR